MVIAVISDVHSNLEALRAVLGDVDARGISSVVCLGDLVGYNADPDACVAAVMARCSQVVRGNHDKAVAGLMDLDWFNDVARAAARWTRQSVRPDTLEAVRTLPRGPCCLEQEESVLLCHGTPFDEDAYLVDEGSVADSYDSLGSGYPGVRVCFHGHTHVPVVVARRRPRSQPEVVRAQGAIRLEPGAVYLVNPGSVGQPRDGTASASFGILDTGKMEYANVRVRYPLEETQRKIQLAGLPASLARRLALGR